MATRVQLKDDGIVTIRIKGGDNAVTISFTDEVDNEAISAFYQLPKSLDSLIAALQEARQRMTEAGE